MKVRIAYRRSRAGSLPSPDRPLAPSAARRRTSIYVPLFTYRTGPFAGSGIPIANGMADYLNMLNERDGGIGGVKLVVEECETGYDTKKGVECYESVKGKNPVVVNPYSTGITLQLIPKAAVDKIPILSMAYGLSASADGNIFPWVFNPPATYWDGASVFVQHVGAGRRRLRQAQGQEDRPRPSRRALRQGADPAARGARQGLWLRRSSSTRCRRGHAEPVARSGSMSAATGRTGSICRAGAR